APRGRLPDAARPAVLGVAGALAVELAELLEVVELDRRLAEHLVLGVHGLDAGQVQERIQQRRAVPGGEHEAVAVAPDGLVRVEAEEALPQNISRRGHAHRRAGVARVGRLHGVHAQRPDRVDGHLLDGRPLTRDGQAGLHGSSPARPRSLRLDPLLWLELAAGLLADEVFAYYDFRSHGFLAPPEP